MVPVLVGVAFITFIMTKLAPGDPVVLMLGNYATPERIEEVREQLGFNDPLLAQFGHYVTNALSGNLGTSFRSQRPVLDEILERLPSTLELAGGAMMVALVLGVPVGVA